MAERARPSRVLDGVRRLPDPRRDLAAASRRAAQGRILVLHGVQSHGGWYHDLGRTLAAEGTRPTSPTGAARERTGRIVGIRPRPGGSSMTWPNIWPTLRRSEPTVPSAWSGSAGAANSRW